MSQNYMMYNTYPSTYTYIHYLYTCIYKQVEQLVMIVLTLQITKTLHVKPPTHLHHARFHNGFKHV